MLCTLSRTANWLVTGRAEMVCTSLHDAGRVALTERIDWVLFCLRGEIDHCAACARWDMLDPQWLL